MLYHDALALLTSHKAKEYMRQKGYLNRQIFPQNGLNDCINGSEAFKGRVVGNHPELMLLDAHLNQDLHKKVDTDVIITKSLP